MNSRFVNSIPLQFDANIIFKPISIRIKKELVLTLSQTQKLGSCTYGVGN